MDEKILHMYFISVNFLMQTNTIIIKFNTNNTFEHSDEQYMQ